MASLDGGSLSSPSPYPTPLTATVIGASISSLLSTAILISTLSPSQLTSITILERSSSTQLKDQGAGIAVGLPIFAAMDKYCGISDPRHYAVQLDAFRFLDHEGSVQMETAASGALWTSTWGQLHRVLRERVERDTRVNIRLGCKLEKLTRSDNGEGIPTVTVGFRDQDGQTQTLETNLVVAADGPSSTVRQLLLPSVSRHSVGYCIFRGLVPATQTSAEAAKTFHNVATFHWAPTQILSYTVPGNQGPADQVPKLINWVWYNNRSEDQIRELLIDKQGKKHAFSVPPGGMRREEMEKIKAQAERDLPPQHREIVQRTDEVFCQVVTDSHAEKSVFWDGSVVLVGDALAGQRPHTASGVLQSLFHAEWLGRLVRGQATPQEFEKETQDFSSILVHKGKELGVICLGDMPAEEKTKAFLPMFFGVQGTLKASFEKLASLDKPPVAAPI